MTRGASIDCDFREDWAVQETIEAVNRAADAGGWKQVRLPGIRAP